MTAHRAINWTLAALIAAVLSTSHLLDGPLITDHSTEQAQAMSLQDAIKAEAAAARFDKASTAICGPNAGWRLLDDGAIQCTTKKGRATVKASAAEVKVAAL
jgi:hypothetical protein